MRDFPGRLHHDVPSWVPESSCFHIRVRCERENPTPLTHPELGVKLLTSVHVYTERGRWWPYLFLLMPDHWHALLYFPAYESMSAVVGDWKRFHCLRHRVVWQENYFDHRLRRTESIEEKAAYIRNNPVVKGLCERPEDWPWVVSAA
jgi:hypothetical protein